MNIELNLLCEPSRATYEAVNPSRATLSSDLKNIVKTFDELVRVGGVLLPQNLSKTILILEHDYNRWSHLLL